MGIIKRNDFIFLNVKVVQLINALTILSPSLSLSFNLIFLLIVLPLLRSRTPSKHLTNIDHYKFVGCTRRVAVAAVAC